MRKRIVTGLLGIAAISLLATYLVQRFEIERLQAETQGLLAQGQKRAAQDAVARAPQPRDGEAEHTERDRAQLLRLRNEVAQLRRERDAQEVNRGDKAPARGDAAQSGSEPGPYISKEQLAFAGYATPDAALESMTWAMLKGTYEQANASLGPEMLEHELEDEKGREHFEAGRNAFGSLFKGMQVLARKRLSEDRVELMLKMDADRLPDGKDEMPPFLIQPMVKVGNEWKLGGSTREGHPADWDGDAQEGGR